MENNESNSAKPQTGLKLMTVFIVVLAAHVLVIGGYAIYNLTKGVNSDYDLAGDAVHKGAKPDAATPVTPAPATPVAADAPTNAPATPAPSETAPAPTATSATPSGPVITPPAAAPKADSVVMSPAPRPELVPAPAPRGEGMTYTVKLHDSFARIAHHNHTTIAKLKEANGLTSNTLHVGQKLVIPSANAVATSAVSEGDTASLSEEAPAATIRNMSSTAPIGTSAAASRHGRTYTVAKGDTLSKIAHKFKTTKSAIMAMNSIANPAKLTIGKKLRIPDREARSATTEKPAADPGQTQAPAPAAPQLANMTVKHDQ